MKSVTADLVRGLIDFAPTEQARQMGFAEQQLEGTVAVYNMLERNRCAYLADEVGMGKTYVALGVMALTRYFDPHARIVVIAPRENIQRKWIKELKNFVRSNWKVVGNRVKSLQHTPAWEPVYCNSVVDFVQESLRNADRDFFLRMTSFSVATKQPEARKRLRKQLLERVPWIDSGELSARVPEAFRDGFGAALNAVFPDADLLVIDEGHNLKHGFGPRVSNRNRVMGLAFGHPEGRSDDRPWYRSRLKRVLLLSATPFEDDYGALQRQLEVLGFGKARLTSGNGDNAVRVDRLLQSDLSEAAKREIVDRLMVRRVAGINIAGTLHTKNMYRREWRQGGYADHDRPMRVSDLKQRLVVGLMQKKVAEVLQNERFNNSFQIGMLSSFESFLESVGRKEKRQREAAIEEEARQSNFDGDQGDTDLERRGIDTDAISDVVNSYRERFGKALPHPKLDATADAFQEAFKSGEKALVFVRRVRTVDELASKLDAHFDRWLRGRMHAALPDLETDIDRLFEQYEKERARRPDEQLEVMPADEDEPNLDELSEERTGADEEADEGSSETFFSWFFRGEGPRGVLSGAAFQKNRLSSQSSVYATFFEDDYVSWLLDRPDKPLEELGRVVQMDQKALRNELRAKAYRHFTHLTKRTKGYPRYQVFLAYQQAALELLANTPGRFADDSQTVLDERFPDPRSGTLQAPEGFPEPATAIGFTSFMTELARHKELRQQLWPEEDPSPVFKERFRRREQRRELLSAMARLGASYIDLYLLAIKSIGSFALHQEAEEQDPVDKLARAFVALLERQRSEPGFGAFYELSHAAQCFDLLLAVNFPDVANGSLDDLAARYGAVLQRQVPVGRMAGGVNRRLVSQFRMPGFPLVLCSTDVLQEGEDLHTFCRRIVHYGITWTPSAMEQRTGRVDRIGGLVQRQLDGHESMPEGSKFLQVYYPHLQDTVEVLQVRRVLRRLNRFLELIHERKGDSEELGSQVDSASEMLEDLTPIPPYQGELQSAFPVREQWLKGQLGAEAVMETDIAGHLKHLDDLWGQFTGRYAVRKLRSANPLIRRGYALVRRRTLLSRDADERGTEQPFRLELRSQSAGDATLLRCSSEVGPREVEHDDETLDELYDLQRDELGPVKICLRPDSTDRTDRIFVEHGMMFHPKTTQVEELDSLVTRTVRAAAIVAGQLIEGEEF